MQNHSTTNKKASRGSVGIEEKAGKLRVRLPRTVIEGSKRYISTGLRNTPENYRKVQRKVYEVEDLLNTRTATLEQIKDILSFSSSLLTLPTDTHYISDIAILWDMYSEYMKEYLKDTTYRDGYTKKWRNHILAIPHKDVKHAHQIQEYLVRNLKLHTAKRVMQYLCACCQWAVRAGHLPHNPFVGMVEDIKPPKKKYEPDPFSREERDAVINAFREHPRYNYYAPFVQFLFLTGCRTGEAVGLQWKHITPDATQIKFCVTYDIVTHSNTSTKTGKTRIFPCNKQLQSLLLSIRPENYNINAPVFPSKTGKHINYTSFEVLCWKGGCNVTHTYKEKQYEYERKGIVTELAKEGKIDHYRKLYCTRHTFITMMIEAGYTAVEVASLVGNTAEVIMTHYAGSCRPITVPEL